MSNKVDIDVEENRIAKDAIEYLEANELVVEVSFPSDTPPSKEVESFLDDYLEEAVLNTDVTSEIIEGLREVYGGDK